MPKPSRRFRPSIEAVVHQVDATLEGTPRPDTIPTGFASVDKLLGGGLRRRDLVLLAGDIGSGKSALALGIAIRTALAGTPVLFLSGEMSEERLMERALAIEGRATIDELRTGKLDDQRRAAVGAAAVRLRGLPLVVRPLAGREFGEVEAAMRVVPRPALVIVDYLQLIPPPARDRCRGGRAGARDPRTQGARADRGCRRPGGGPAPRPRGRTRRSPSHAR